MRWCCLFPLTMNVHLTKDIGMIPYMLRKIYNFDAVIACYNNDNYSYLEEDVKGLKLEFINKYFKNDLVNGIVYLFKKSKYIDVLNLYHPSTESLLWALTYKLLNRKGKVYLKMDASMDTINLPRPFFRSDIRAKLKIQIIKKYVDLLSAETIGVVELLKQNNIDAIHIPNGFYSIENDMEINKENTIITVGRIGSNQKRNDILLKSIERMCSELEGWKIKFIGPIEEKFRLEIDRCFNVNPNLKEMVEFVGPIYDKEVLNEEYKKAKIFCLTSDWEGFPLVIPEAGKNGDYLVCSDIDVAKTVITDSNIGLIFNKGSVKDLCEKLLQACKICSNGEFRYRDIQKKFYKDYYWPELVGMIKKKLDKE